MWLHPEVVLWPQPSVPPDMDVPLVLLLRQPSDEAKALETGMALAF